MRKCKNGHTLYIGIDEPTTICKDGKCTICGSSSLEDKTPDKYGIALGDMVEIPKMAGYGRGIIKGNHPTSECYAIEFEKPTAIMHNCKGLCKPGTGYFIDKTFVKKVPDGKPKPVEKIEPGGPVSQAVLQAIGQVIEEEDDGSSQ
jgi:hypothetical protein